MAAEDTMLDDGDCQDHTILIFRKACTEVDADTCEPEMAPHTRWRQAILTLGQDLRIIYAAWLNPLSFKAHVGYPPVPCSSNEFRQPRESASHMSLLFTLWTFKLLLNSTKLRSGQSGRRTTASVAP